MNDDTSQRGFSRRRVLQGAAAVGVAAWIPFEQIPAAQAALPTPPTFPSGIPLFQQSYRNWSGAIAVDGVWTCTPSTPADVVTLANWARAHGWRLRAKGSSHNWSPLSLAADGSDAADVVLVDTKSRLTAISVDTATSRVRVQTGATMLAMLTALEAAGLGLTATPAPGDLTVGGVLAIDGHGTAVPRTGETRPAGHTYGSVSNLVQQITAVVWDAATSSYVLRTYQRNDVEAGALMAHVGRSFITEVVLQAGANQRLRCQSWFDVPATELFAPAGSGGKTFDSYLRSAGRVEAIWFPFTAKPWLKVWSVAPSKPFFSRQVTSPYNYTFSDNLPQSIFDLSAQIVSSNPANTPGFGDLNYNIVAAGLVTTFTYDIWGWSKNLLLYVRPSTLRVTANGYAILCKRADVQRVIHEFTSRYSTRLDDYRSQGRFPMNGPVEIRVTGVDRPGDVGATRSAQLSALRPRPDHPEWDSAVWLDILTLPGTPYADEFYAEMEQWIYSNYASYADVRPEWSKGWGYTSSGAWTSDDVVDTKVPTTFRTGYPLNDNWDSARAMLDILDPARVFTSAFVDRLLL
ncbi:cholesterol oxidase substrate-binding domain-containing protein [Nocardioides sp. URHA0020]|uniref:cholesterol oxidase substrate-binding domain-containing protein n=1 Tax=Nocardioides sp. URHA0020 TaxID=1380392 RepID=UPI000490D58A|nr:cholesterol oxidase substrate-binding domain-containing protein [Nocardioides sp. URHA0020]